MRKYLLLLFSLTAALPMLAQLNGDGFYRVRNVATGRYICVIDNYGRINTTATTADLSAIKTVSGFDNVASLPGTIIYIQKVDDKYKLYSQGTDTYTIIQHFLSLRERDGHYLAYATSEGMTKYLADEEGDDPEGVLLTAATASQEVCKWDLIPVTTASNYFGLAPTVNVGSQYYQTFYASFACTFTSSATKAYYINKVDGNLAVMKELSGTLAPATPVIVASTSSSAADNKLTPAFSGGSSPSGSLLKGVYFCNPQRNTSSPHHDVVNYDANTMRVLGKTSDGKLGFVTSTEQYIAANTAYLTVPAGSPAELQVVTEAEYNALIAERENDRVTLTANSYTRVYGDANPSFGYTVSGTGTLKGQPVVSCEATAQSPVGTYPIVISKGTVSNYHQTYVNGTLTITAAPLVASAGTYSREYGLDNPAFSVSYSGFRNGDTESVLTTKATATTAATAASHVGTYPVTVSGGAAQNYTLSYQNGSLDVTKAPLEVSVGNYVRDMGQENPVFELVYSGFRNGDTESVFTSKPTATTEATAQSPVGDYAIVVSGGAAQDYSLTYKNGTLTVNAPAGIDELLHEGRPVNVYSPAGYLVRKQTTSLDGLPAGIYVVNGQKVVVK